MGVMSLLVTYARGDALNQLLTSFLHDFALFTKKWGEFEAN
jgi:hypothetical protein